MSSRNACPTAEELTKLHKNYQNYEQIREQLFAELRYAAKDAPQLIWKIPSHALISYQEQLKAELTKNGLQVIDQPGTVDDHWVITWKTKTEQKAEDQKGEKKTDKKDLVFHDEALAASQYQAVFDKLLRELTLVKQNTDVCQFKWQFPDGWWDTRSLYKLQSELAKRGFASKYVISDDEFELRLAAFEFTWTKDPTSSSPSDVKPTARSSDSAGNCWGYNGTCGGMASAGSSYCYECRGF